MPVNNKTKHLPFAIFTYKFFKSDVTFFHQQRQTLEWSSYRQQHTPLPTLATWSGWAKASHCVVFLPHNKCNTPIYRLIMTGVCLPRLYFEGLASGGRADVESCCTRLDTRAGREREREGATARLWIPLGRLHINAWPNIWDPSCSFLEFIGCHRRG